MWRICAEIQESCGGSLSRTVICDPIFQYHAMFNRIIINPKLPILRYCILVRIRYIKELIYGRTIGYTISNG